MNQVYTIVMLVLTGLVMTAQTAFATNEHDYKVGFRLGINDYRCNQPGCETPRPDAANIKCGPGPDNLSA